MEDIVYFYPTGHQSHAEAGHPERPERVEAVRAGLMAAGWWDPYPKLIPLPLPEGVLSAVHIPGYVDELRAASGAGRRLDMDTYTTPTSCELAHTNAGGGLAVARAVWEREAHRGFALTRPPGHHATRSRGMGFCLLNNVALAAEYLIQENGARRLAIVDLDLHHGNGTQDIFWRRSDVFFISVHQSPLYPGTGSLIEVGEGPGKNFTANFPLPPGSGDQAYRAFMRSLILPLLDRYNPEMLLVSFGFDPHWRDPLGHLLLSAEVYGEMIRSITSWADGRCQGKVALFLEGGYDLEAGAACGQACVAALLGQSWQDPLGPSPRMEVKSWQSVLQAAGDIWGLV